MAIGVQAGGRGGGGRGERGAAAPPATEIT